MVPLYGAYLREKESKRRYTHSDPVGDSMRHIFPFPASKREGRKASSRQTQKQHARFSWLERYRGIPILAYILGTRALQACHGWAWRLAARKHQPAPTMRVCPEHPVSSRGCECRVAGLEDEERRAGGGSQRQRGRMERLPKKRDSPSFASAQNRPFFRFSDAYTFCGSVR